MAKLVGHLQIVTLKSRKQLLDLPNETLFQIIGTIPPYEGLEELTLCSKLLLELGAKALQKHRRMKRYYSKQDFVPLSQPHPVFFLRHIVTDNNIAPYVTKLAVGRYCSLYGYREDQSDYIRKAAKECASSVMNVLNESPYFTTGEKARLHRAFLEGSRETVFTLLVLMLPNLTCIAFPDGQGVPPLITGLVTRISRAAQSDANTVHPLGRLSKMSLSRFKHINRPGMYDAFKTFASLPSMRSLSGEGIDGHSCSWDLDLGEPMGTSIRSLAFSRSCMDTESLNNLLRASNNLQDFSYSHTDDFTKNKVAHLSPGDVIQGLLRYAKDTLTSLDLTNHTRPWSVSIFNEYTCHSLLSFRVLKNIRMDYTMFSSANSRSIYAQSSRCGPTGCQVFRLVDTLPASVETMTFSYGCDHQIANRLLEGIPTSGCRALPRLKQVTFEDKVWFVLADTADDGLSGVVIDKAIKKSCQKAGIRLLWGEQELVSETREEGSGQVV